MPRVPLVVAAVLAVVAGSGSPVPAWGPSVSVDVDGLEAFTHRPLLLMSAGGAPFGTQDPCESGVFALYGNRSAEDVETT